MEIKALTSYYIVVRIIKIQNTAISTNGKVWWKQELFFTGSEQVQLMERAVWWSFPELYIKLTTYPGVRFLGIYQVCFRIKVHKNMHTNVSSNFTCNHPNLHPRKLSMAKWTANCFINTFVFFFSTIKSNDLPSPK